MLELVLSRLKDLPWYDDLLRWLLVLSRMDENPKMLLAGVHRYGAMVAPRTFRDVAAEVV